MRLEERVDGATGDGRKQRLALRPRHLRSDASEQRLELDEHLLGCPAFLSLFSDELRDLYLQQ